MNKNNLILIGIVLLFLLVIRPLSSKKTVEEPAETAEAPEEEEKELDVNDPKFTPYPFNGYVTTSLKNAENTQTEALPIQGQTHTV